MKHQSPQRRWQRRWHYWYYRVIRLQSSPRAIARGLAAGVFAGCFPIFGLQTVVGVAISILLRGNKLVAAAGTWVSNPLTYVPIYGFNLWVGQRLLRTDLDNWLDSGLTSWDHVVQSSHTLLLTLFVGSAVVGTVAALLAYLLGVWLGTAIHHRRQQRRHQRRIKKLAHAEESP